MLAGVLGIIKHAAHLVCFALYLFECCGDFLRYLLGQRRFFRFRHDLLSPGLALQHIGLRYERLILMI